MMKGWQTKTLGDVCYFENGDRGENYPSRSVQTTSGVPFINAGHLSESGVDFTEMNYIPRERFAILGNGKIQKEDILFCLRGSLGKFASVGDLSEGAIASSLVIIRPSNEVLNEFILAYFQSDLCAEMIRDFRNGAAQPNLAATSLKKFRIPIPPLAEQQRIVAVLDEAFAGLATAQAHAEKNLQNARELFDSYLETVFTQRGDGWVERRFEDLIHSSMVGLTRSSREQNSENQYPYVKMNNITLDNRFDFKSHVKVNASREEVDRFALQAGDFLFNTRNSHELVGKSCLFSHETNDIVLYNNNIMRIRFRSEIDARFILHAFSSGFVREQLEGMKSGTTNVSAIYYKDLINLRVSLPPLLRQVSISQALSNLSSETQRLATIYEQKLAALTELKKSLLHQAFSGEL
jgi:type I restriction enzyme S subunit